jgi:segregation and condensation protein B
VSSADLKKTIVECLIFASEKPISAGKLAEIASDSIGATERKVDVREVRRIVEQLRQEYDAHGRAFQIEEIAEGYRMLTRPEYHQWVRALVADRQQAKLSPAAIETLAIVAYKQPISRAQIEDIRGVQSDQVLRTVMEKRLVKVVGRENVPGRPLLYGTTREFLDHFGLKSIKDLPTIKELAPPT